MRFALVRVWAGQVRASRLVWAVPVVLGVAVYVASRLVVPGVGLWIDASSAIVSSVLAAGPFAAACGAVSGVEARRADNAPLLGTAARDPFVTTALSVVASATWAAVVYGVVTVALWIRTWALAGPGFPSPLWLAVGATELLLFAAAGYAAGAVVPHRLTPLVAAATAYLVPATLLAWSGPLVPLLSPVSQLRPTVWREVAPDVLGWQAVWFLGLTVTLIAAGAVGRSRWVSLRLPAGAGMLAVGAGTAAVLALSPQVSPLRDAPPVPPVCADRRPLVVCVHPAYSAQLPTLVTIFAGVNGAFGWDPTLPDRFVQVGGRVSLPSGEQPFTLVGTADDERRILVEDYLASVFTSACPPGDVPPATAAVLTWITEWLVSGEISRDPVRFGYYTGTDARAFARFSAESDTWRREWLRRNVPQLEHCAVRYESIVTS